MDFKVKRFSVLLLCVKSTNKSFKAERYNFCVKLTSHTLPTVKILFEALMRREYITFYTQVSINLWFMNYLRLSLSLFLSGQYKFIISIHPMSYGEYHVHSHNTRTSTLILMKYYCLFDNIFFFGFGYWYGMEWTFICKFFFSFSVYLDEKFF